MTEKCHYTLRRRINTGIIPVLISILMFSQAAFICLQPLLFADDFDSFSDLDGEKSPSYSLKGFIEFENFISTGTDQDPEDIYRKREVRNRVSWRYGSDTAFFLLNADMYHNLFQDNDTGYSYSDEFRVQRDLSISSVSDEIAIRECYFNYQFNNVRVRAGNQIFAWGTADVFNATAYFNPLDMREFIMRDDDELRRAIPAISSMIFFGDDSVEIVISPVHVPIFFPPGGNFWAIEYREGPFPVRLLDPEEKDISVMNTGAAVQYYTNRRGLDINVNLFHGPDSEPVLRPLRSVTVPNEPVRVAVAPEYYIVNRLGLALSKSIDKFVFQAECSWSPDRTGVVDQEFSSTTELPFKTAKSHSVSYSAGANWFVPLDSWISGHRGETVLTLEWYQSFYTDPRIMEPLISDILSISLQDTFWNDRIDLSFKGLIDTSNRSFALIPEGGYRFRSGICVSASWLHIKSGKGSFLGYFRGKDIATVGVRYEY